MTCQDDEIKSLACASVSLGDSMRLVATMFLIALGLAPGGPAPSFGSPADGDAYHIVLPKRGLGAGESVELRLVPPPPAGAHMNYGTMIGTIGIDFPGGVYRAPYVIASGASPIRVTAGFSADGFRAGATTEIDLLPGSVPGAEDCLGPGQSFSPVTADIDPSFVELDELPYVVHKVEPEYPRSAFVRGTEETILVKTLVCRSGRVLDAYALPRYPRGPSPSSEPIEQDPKLIEAAVSAVRQYLFSPGKKGGQAFAVWVHVPVAFHR